MAADYLDFVDSLCALSPWLQTTWASIRVEWQSDPPLPTLMLAALGHAIAGQFQHLDAHARREWFDRTERGLASSSRETGEAIATGSLEGLWNAAVKDQALAAQVLQAFGPQSREYIDAWDAFHGIYR